MMQHDVALAGCAPIPLAHYLKALGILRLVAEQADPDARGFWEDDVFIFTSKFDKANLMNFLLYDYSPTPLVAPWNGGSGFSPDDNRDALELIRAGETSRLKAYRDVINCAFSIRERMGIVKKVEESQKLQLLSSCRSEFPDAMLSWLDAAYVLTDDGAKYPPLFGTGGNDGRLEFTNNYMQRICAVFDNASGAPTPESSSWLDNALFGTTVDTLVKSAPIGQFHPGAAGGPNSISGFDSNSLINPWDYILLVEGALFFAAASTKRLQKTMSGLLSYPFSVYTSAAGYGSSASVDASSSDSRAELWVPLWSAPTSATELKYLMSEGRAQVSKHPARTGVDFARAIATLGIDRGITSFQRYGFLKRNGLAYFATPLGRFQVKEQPHVNLLTDIDDWLDSFRGKAASDKAPASARRALRVLEESIMRLCRNSNNRQLQEVLIALGGCEMTLSTSRKWAEESGIRPLSTLSSRWLSDADDGTAEFRLAASLASVYGYFKDADGRSSILPLRSNMEQVHQINLKEKTLSNWNEVERRDVVWINGDLIRSMNAVLGRRITAMGQSGAETYTDRGKIMADLGDIADFIEGNVNDGRLTKLLWGLTLIDWRFVDARVQGVPRKNKNNPGAAYGALKICFAENEIRDKKIPLVPEIHRRAANGDLLGGLQLAARRLAGCGLSLVATPFDTSHGRSQRIAASLLFPVSTAVLAQLSEYVLKKEIEEKDTNER